MRTKTILLVAALSAIGVASSMAQVYSINTVGYVNTVMKGNNAFTLAANPLSNSTSPNTVVGLVDGLANKSSVQTWNGAGFNGSSKAGGVWSTPGLALGVGTGFFVKNGAATNTTITFVGTVIPNPGGTSTVALPANVFVLAGSTLPVAGDLQASSDGVGKLNLNATLANKSSVQTWDNSGAGAFAGSSKAGGIWSNPTLLIDVGKGAFIKSGTAVNWVQTYP